MSKNRGPESDPNSNTITRRQLAWVTGTSAVVLLGGAMQLEGSLRDYLLTPASRVGVGKPAAPMPLTPVAKPAESKPAAAVATSAPAVAIPELPNLEAWGRKYDQLAKGQFPADAGSRSIIDAAARAHIIQGVEISRTKPSFADLSYDSQAGVVIVDDQKYDLKTFQGLAFAGAAVYAELFRSRDADTMPFDPQDQIARLNRRISLDLEGPSVPPLVNANMLAWLYLGTLRPIEQAGVVDIPKRWKSTARTDFWDPNSGELSFAWSRMPSALPRMIGALNPDLVKQVEKIVDGVEDGEKNVDLLTLPEGGLLSRPGLIFANGLNDYLRRGVEYLYRERYLNEVGARNGARIVRQQYELFRELFGGREFPYDGVLGLSQPVYNAGDIVRARDLMPERSGDISLQPSPRFGESTSVKVGHGADLLLIEKSPVVLDSNLGLAMDMWRVVELTRLSRGRLVSGADSSRGYIGQKWLGEHVRSVKPMPDSL